MAKKRVSLLVEEIMNLVVRFVDRLGVLEDPVRVLVQRSGKSQPWISLCLKELEADGKIEITLDKTDRNRIQRIKITDKKTLENQLPKNNGNESIFQEKEEPKPAKFFREKKKIVVLVDYDNVASTCSELGQGLSLQKLRTFVRQFGVPIFLEVFISPWSKTRDSRVIEKICRAGFKAIACPLVEKDVDRTDHYLKASARSYISHSNAEAIIIVSEDADFLRDSELINFAGDEGKEICFLSPTANLKEIEGEEEDVVLGRDLAVRDFLRILDHLEKGEIAKDLIFQRKSEFLFDVIRAIKELTSSNFKYPFKHLLEKVREKLFKKWKGTVSQSDFRSAMTALGDKGILLVHQGKIGGRTLNYYLLNQTHVVLRRMSVVVESVG